MTRLITTTALALTLAAGSAHAESHTNGEKVEQNLENAGESLEKAGENAAQATGNAAGDAADASEKALENAAQATENAAEATEQAAEDAAQATGNAVDDAATATANATDGMLQNDTNMIRARDIMGGTIYSANAQDGVAEFETVTYDSVGEDWENIGEIEDIVLSSDGQLQGVVAEIGGFLGMGDKHVFVPMDSVKLIPVEDADMALVVGYSEEQLVNMKNVDEAFWE
ncbi:MAG: PRC-barrel domain-containing protein [Rhodobacterales bacterium]|nr:PRC-barrel domain-containing protein [Puniceibacterium antarcticum]